MSYLYQNQTAEKTGISKFQANESEIMKKGRTLIESYKNHAPAQLRRYLPNNPYNQETKYSQQNLTQANYASGTSYVSRFTLKLSKQISSESGYPESPNDACNRIQKQRKRIEDQLERQKKMVEIEKQKRILEKQTRHKRETEWQTMKFKQQENMQSHYKTELCKNWEQTGTCDFRDQCAYAHGYEEMQSKPVGKLNKGYKTKLCKQWHQWTPGYCRYGKKCQFMHNEFQSKKGSPQKKNREYEIIINDSGEKNDMEITDKPKGVSSKFLNPELEQPTKGDTGNKSFLKNNFRDIIDQEIENIKKRPSQQKYMSALETLDQCLQEKDEDNSSSDEYPPYEGLEKAVIGVDQPTIQLNWAPTPTNTEKENEFYSDDEDHQCHELNIDELKHNLVKWKSHKVPDFNLDMCIEEHNESTQKESVVEESIMDDTFLVKQYSTKEDQLAIQPKEGDVSALSLKPMRTSGLMNFVQDACVRLQKFKNIPSYNMQRLNIFQNITTFQNYSSSSSIEQN